MRKILTFTHYSHEQDLVHNKMDNYLFLLITMNEKYKVEKRIDKCMNI